MNTGAGKTPVDLILLQSSLNGGVFLVAYFCPDKYLNAQVIVEAKQLGIAVVEEPRDAAFRSDEAILVDTIHTLFNGRSVFGVGTDNKADVKLFVKLPSWFTIDTPIGPYNPDWAFVTEREGKLYFVRETKSTLDSEERRPIENQKVACGGKHFEKPGVDFDVVTSLGEVAI